MGAGVGQTAGVNLGSASYQLWYLGQVSDPL